MAVFFWRLLALASVSLGLVGIVLPGLPTVPFLLLAAWAAGHGWPRLERWLLTHTHFGPPIRRWRAHGAVPRNVKWLASMAMLGSSLTLWLMDLPLWLRMSVPMVLLFVAFWLWRQPEN